jgi:hypothetical protein
MRAHIGDLMTTPHSRHNPYSKQWNGARPVYRYDLPPPPTPTAPTTPAPTEARADWGLYSKAGVGFFSTEHYGWGIAPGFGHMTEADARLEMERRNHDERDQIAAARRRFRECLGY